MKPPENRHGRGPIAKSAFDSARAALEAWSGAALLVEPKAAVLVAANAAGRDYFPAVAGNSQVLDSAMPAVGALRAVAQSGAMPAESVPLVFWTARGIFRFSGQIELMKGVEGQTLLLVKMIECRGATAEGAASGAVVDLEAGPGATAQGLISSEIPQIDLAKLAHELKTPLSAISAASEIMKEGRFGQIENQRYAGYIADIHESARHALELIERMLNRRGDSAEAQTSDFKFEKIDLDDLVEICISTLRPLASAKGLSLAAQRAAIPAMVMADATALKQIVLNLIMNSIKFTPAGGLITLTVGSRQGAAALTVEDTGPGMTAVAIIEAMRPLPLDVPSARDGGGFGLGLPMSRALAEAMGAQLAIDSMPGRGTRVILTFPGGEPLAIQSQSRTS
jgi:signal transduction histidine kinase